MIKVNIGIANLFVTKKLKDAYFNKGLLNESKKISSGFVEILKNSPILQLEYKVFNNIESKHIDNDLTASRYIDNNIKLFEIYTIKEIETEHKKLDKFVSKSKNFDENKYELYINIGNLINESLQSNEKVDVDNIHESFTYVLNYIKEPKNVISIDNDLINENIIDLAINKYNDRYQSLDENDKTLLNLILKSNIKEKENIFETIKRENIELLEKVNKSEITELAESKITSTINKINAMKFNKKNVDTDIIQLHELKKRLL